MKRAIIFLIILMLIFSGCTSIKRTEEPKKDYRTGKEGLTIEFPVDLPEQMYENDKDIKFIVEVKNEGAFPQADEDGFEGKLWVGGYDPDILPITPESEDLDETELSGKSHYNEQGGSTAVDFTAGVEPLPEGVSYFPQTILFTVTYAYKTIASPIVCIDPEPRSTTIRDKVCSVRDITLSSQGAPIAVTKIEEDIASDRILFKIYLENVGDGLVIPDEKVGNDPNEGYEWGELNKVEIDVKVGKDSIDCRPKDKKIELIEGKGYIFCSMSKPGDKKVYTTPLNIELTYGYSSSVSKSIEIFGEIK